MTSLVLVFNPVGDISHKTWISDKLKELCNFWVLLSSNDNESTLNDVHHAMEGVDGDILNFASMPVGDLESRLGELLQGKATHLMFLQPGAVVECEGDFAPATNNRPEQVLHLSPARDIGCWQTSIVPNLTEFWTLNDCSNIVASQQQNDHRNNKIQVLDHNRFPHRRSPDRNQIQAWLRR